jgi:hypothetical protein
MEKLDTKLIAPEGQVWLCMSCGKIAKYRYGYVPGYPCSRGWDESCVLNSDLVAEEFAKQFIEANQ